MTKSQLQTIGILYGEWVSLEQSVQVILFSNDGAFYPNKNTKFYFSNDGLVFVRKYLNASTPIEGGLIDSTVGQYHDVYDIDAITLIR